MAYPSRERPTNDPTATAKLATNSHHSAHSGLRPAKTGAAKTNALHREIGKAFESDEEPMRVVLREQSGYRAYP
jgi:hypothetical protein